MKIIACLLVASILMIACNNSADKTPVEDSSVVATRFYWEAADTGRLYLVRREGEGPAAQRSDSVISFLNTKYPNVQLAFVKTSNDTLFIKIPESTYLTQQMGSSGPSYFFAEVVYNLTEIEGVRYVNFDFEEGDHASPGTMSRDSFHEE